MYSRIQNKIRKTKQNKKLLSQNALASHGRAKPKIFVKRLQAHEFSVPCKCCFKFKTCSKKKEVSTFLKKMREIQVSTAHFNEIPVIFSTLLFFKVLLM